jgi:phosphoenolpyruvate carboxylase
MPFAGSLQIQAAFRTDEIRRTQPTPQDEMRAGMSYFHETIWKGVPKFLRRVDTALKNIGIDERLPYNAPLIQFSSWMGGDRDGKFTLHMMFLVQYMSGAEEDK